MERITISIESDLARLLDQMVHQHGYSSRSEAVRDLVRGWHSDHTLRQDESGHCVAHVGYVYKHHDRSMSERMAKVQHQHHDLVVSSMHMHLDHDNCLEIAVLRGLTKDVRSVANAVIAQTGVRHGSIQIIPVQQRSGSDEHQHGSEPHHVHLSPNS